MPVNTSNTVRYDYHTSSHGTFSFETRRTCMWPRKDRCGVQITHTRYVAGGSFRVIWPRTISRGFRGRENKKSRGGHPGKKLHNPCENSPAGPNCVGQHHRLPRMWKSVNVLNHYELDLTLISFQKKARQKISGTFFFSHTGSLD